MIGFFSIFAFKLDFLQLGCTIETEPAVTFAMRIFMVIGIFLLMCLVHVVAVLIYYSGDFKNRRHVLIGTTGMVFSGFFISIATSILSAFQCQKNPNGLFTV